ncbi:hypothetical protein [Corticibacter populi]|nr:hypothetical protein [Corticibacter populi]
MKKILIANRGESRRAAVASAERRACAAGDGDLAMTVVVWAGMVK